MIVFEMNKEKKSQKEKVLRTAKVVGTRGRIFYGNVIKKFPNRIVIEFDRSVYITKYERFMKKKTKLHARIPQGMEVEVGDYVKVQECRPLSKIIHFIALEVVKGESDVQEKKVK